MSWLGNRTATVVLACVPVEKAGVRSWILFGACYHRDGLHPDALIAIGPAPLLAVSTLASLANDAKREVARKRALQEVMRMQRVSRWN